MTRKEYAEKGKETMVYPTHKEMIPCVMCGVIEEWFEVQKTIVEYEQKIKGTKEDILDELGDLLYYLVAITDYFGYAPSSDGPEFSIFYHVPAWTKCLNKMIRDDNYTLVTPKRILEFKEVANAVYADIALIALTFGFTLDAVMEANVAKLQKRKAAGTITGDGSHR